MGPAIKRRAAGGGLPVAAAPEQNDPLAGRWPRERHGAKCAAPARNLAGPRMQSDRALYLEADLVVCRPAGQPAKRPNSPLAARRPIVSATGGPRRV